MAAPNTIVAVTGRLLTRMDDRQVESARRAAAKHGVSVAEWVRVRLAARVVGGK